MRKNGCSDDLNQWYLRPATFAGTSVRLCPMPFSFKITTPPAMKCTIPNRRYGENRQNHVLGLRVSWIDFA
jgi:hypothetical protein